MDTQTPGQRHTNEELYERQVETLRRFLQNGAITQAQFDKSYGDLTAKMRFSHAREDDKS